MVMTDSIVSPSAHLAVPVLDVFGDPRQEFARVRHQKDREGAIAHELRQSRVKRHGEMQSFARVGVNDCEQRRIGAIEVSLVQGDLRRIDLE
jgi:hypothetical protein